MQVSIRTAGLLALAAVGASGNWGGEGGGSYGTGAFRAFGTAQVEMVNEDLAIRLYRDRARVQVEYTLRNTGGPVDVKAGFPSLELVFEQKTYPEVIDYRLTADGKEVPFYVEKGDLGNWKSYFAANYVEMAGPGAYDFDNHKPCSPCGLWWLASTVHFDAGQTRHIRINYESRYQYGEGGPSGDSTYLADQFRYLLSPAATWKGPIQHGRVTITAVSMDPKVLLIKPLGRFKLSGGSYAWEFDNLKPTLADNIEVSMNNGFKTVMLRGPDVKDNAWYSFEGTRYWFDFHDYRATASSSANEYPPENVADMAPMTAWVAGRNGGVGESLTLTLDRPAHVDQLGIIPGYAKSRELYFANNRVQEIEIRVNGGPPVLATLPDEYIGFGPGSYKAYHLITPGSYSGNAKYITLTVKKIYPGSLYNDLCISEVLLRKRLPVKPEASGGR